MRQKRHVVLDAMSLFQLQLKKMPQTLRELQKDIVNGKIIAVIPTIAISEILWKKRREGPKQLSQLKIAFSNWKKAPNLIIDSFDVAILENMMQTKESYELHDEIIAMTCKKYNTTIIYTKDPKFKDFWGLTPISW